MRKFYLVATSLLLLLKGLPSMAEDVPGNNEYDTTVTMDTIVVSATKTEEKRKDVPNAVIVLDEMDIEESPAKSIGELLANELGIDWRTYGDYGGAGEEIHIRGMSGNATQIFVNGINVNSPSLGSADVGSIPLNNIEKIEVVKGSGSLLYGSGAMGGTVNIITKMPEHDRITGGVRAGYGTEESYMLEAEQGMYLTENFGYYLTATRRETDGFRDNSDLTHNDVSLKLVFDKGDKFDVSLYGDYVDRKYDIPGVQPPAGTQDYFIGPVKFYNSETAKLLDNGKNENAHLVLKIKSKLYKWLTVNIETDYVDLERFNLSRYSGTGGTGNKTWTTNEVLGIEGNLNIKPFAGANILAGTEYKNFNWENTTLDLDTGGIDIPGSSTTTEASIHTLGSFIETQYRPWERLKLLAGVRYENHSTFGSEVLPLFGLVLNATDRTAIKFSHGKHFLAPTPNDLFWPATMWMQGDPNLKPENGWHTDATIEQSLYSDKLFTSITYFHWDIDDKIEWGPNSFWVWTPHNLNRYKADGLEVGLKSKPFDWLRLGLNYTYIDASEMNQSVTRRAQYTPEHQAKAVITYWLKSGFTTQFTVRYTGSRYYYGFDKTIVEPTNTLDSYWTTDFKIDKRFHENWIVTLQGNNLFDEEYDTYLASFTDQNTSTTTINGYPGSGRAVYGSIAYEF